MAGCVREDQVSPAAAPSVPKKRCIHYDNRTDGGDALSFGLLNERTPRESVAERRLFIANALSTRGFVTSQHGITPVDKRGGGFVSLT